MKNLLRKSISLSSMMLSLTLSGCGAFGILPDGQISRTFDFRDGLQGWEAEVADYPVEQVSNLQLQAALRDLPDELGVEGSGFRVQSFNTPDDLFTFIKRRLTVIDGIRAGETYIVHYSVLLASNAPSGCAGVGGAPGESVYVKVGASPIEPAPRLSQDGLEMVPNVDVGDQATGGAAASVAGTLANGVPCDLIPDLESAPYVLILREREHTNVVTASDGGVLWLLVGTDSGFESLTALYYLRIDVTLTLLSNGTDSTDDSPAG